MKEFGGVSRRDSELRDAVVRRIKRRRQWQVVQGETCESGAKVDRRPKSKQHQSSLSGCQQRRRERQHEAS